MGKGRKFAPCEDTDGNWYKCKSSDNLSGNKSVPSSVFPTIFQKNIQESCKKNLFSIHDNRHSLQAKGEYFGNGLGKRIDRNRSQHLSNNIQANRFIGPPSKATGPPFKSNYCISFTDKHTSPCEYRRFPRKYETPKVGKTDLTTSTMKWWQPKRTNDAPNMTELKVLALTQEPHTKPNKWKYSYNPSIFSWIATRCGHS